MLCVCVVFVEEEFLKYLTYTKKSESSVFLYHFEENIYEMYEIKIKNKNALRRLNLVMQLQVSFAGCCCHYTHRVSVVGKCCLCIIYTFICLSHAGSNAFFVIPSKVAARQVETKVLSHPSWLSKYLNRRKLVQIKVYYLHHIWTNFSLTSYKTRLMHILEWCWICTMHCTTFCPGARKTDKK